MVARGEVWWIDFGEPVGPEPAYLHPALVVSSDRFNRSRIATVIVSAITGDLPAHLLARVDDGLRLVLSL